ncbi:MAG: hypothetical protein M3R41_02215 [Pseudomonadota bacterium]|nr:hypothetical protein [Pseudomonadota bacterium]
MKSLAPALLLALAACSGKADDKAQPTAPKPSAHDARSEAAIQNAVAAGGRQAVPKGVPVGDPPAIVTNANALPAAFQGKWGMTAGDCDISRGDSVGKMIVRVDKLTFYTATATITHLTKTSQYQVTADLALEGGGKAWQARQRFDLTRGGTQLLRIEQTPAKTYRYQRC